MFGWFRRQNAKQAAVPAEGLVAYCSLKDAGNSGFYIGFVRKQLEEVASALGRGIQTRFNSTKKCAELYNDWGVIARVYGNGECGVIYGVTITSWGPLPDTTKGVFREKLQSLSVHFEPAT